MRFDRARMTTMRSRRARKILLVPRTSIHARQDVETPPGHAEAIHRSWSPTQPAACTVPTSCPANSAARARGRFSSSRTRTGQNGIPSRIECGNRRLLRHRRELIEELVEGLSPFQIVEHRLNRHPRAAEDRHTPRDLRVAVDDRERIDHAIIIRHRSGRGARRSGSSSLVRQCEREDRVPGCFPSTACPIGPAWTRPPTERSAAPRPPPRFRRQRPAPAPHGGLAVSGSGADRSGAGCRRLRPVHAG